LRIGCLAIRQFPYSIYYVPYDNSAWFNSPLSLSSPHTVKKCSYCGRDNADDASNCRECGTEFEREAAKPTEAGDQTPERRTLAIRIFLNRELAEIAAAKLKAHGIDAWVDCDDCAGMYPNLTAAEGARLKVWEDDESIATAVLDAKPTPEESREIEVEAVLATPLPPEPKRKLAWGQLVVVFFLGVLASLVWQWRQDRVLVTHYEYSPDGKCTDAWIYRGRQLVEHLEDRNLDGQWDYWAHYEFGRVARAEYDNNFEGKPDEFWTNRPDGANTMEKDTDFNGVPDMFYTYKFRIIQTAEMRPNGSKFATERQYYRNGVLTEVWRGGDSNGNFREVIKYDPFLNPIATNAPGQPLSPPPVPK